MMWNQMVDNDVRECDLNKVDAQDQVKWRRVAVIPPANMQSILDFNIFRIIHCGEAVNYRLYVSPSFEVASQVN